MKIRIANLSAALDDERPIDELVAEHLKIPAEKILSVEIVRRAVDARRFRGAPIKFNYVVDVEIRGKVRGKNFRPVPDKSSEIFTPVNRVPEKNPIVVGFGAHAFKYFLILPMNGGNLPHGRRFLNKHSVRIKPLKAVLEAHVAAIIVLDRQLYLHEISFKLAFQMV